MTSIHRPILIDIGLLLIRLMLAVVFIFHGSQKLFSAFGGSGLQGFADHLEGMGVPMPMLAAIVSACVEFFGGVVLFIGSGTRIAAGLLAINMFVAVILVHGHAFSLQAQPPGMEYALTLCVVSLALVFTGPGRLTIRQLLARRK